MKKLHLLFITALCLCCVLCVNAQNCKQFVDYQTKTIDFKGLSLGLLSKISGKTDGLTSIPILREVSDELQKLDLLQYNMCNQIKSCKSEYVKEKLAFQQNNIMSKMMNMQENAVNNPVQTDNETGVPQQPQQNVTAEKQPAAPPANPVDLDFSIPCSGDNYYSTDEIIRGTGEGWSMDAQMSKRAARTAALEDLAAKIEITVKTLCEDYQISKKNGMEETFVSQLENKTQTVVNQTISGWKTICEKMRHSPEQNRYTCYMAVEISVKQILDGTYAQLKADAQLANQLPPRAEFDKKFKEVMNEFEQSNEMELDF